MDVIFDPPKDALNIKKHGISLQRAEDFDHDTAIYDVDDSQDYGEVRWKALCWLDALLHMLTFTQENETVIRAISLRTATRQERQKYAKEFDT